MDPKFTNSLINESSPYLRQHAHNPVNWFSWNTDSLQKAISEDKPVLVSIGYSACHWCHVMEHESFENEEVADYMNTHFINIKIDREERPDLDHIYMDAVQAISGSGGWPLNVFLTTDLKPFYGGTYFPPQRAFNRPSWLEILEFINDAWKNRREEIETQADTLIKHIENAGNLLVNKLSLKSENEEIFTENDCKEIAANILKQADVTYGGFGKAPKFPQTFTIQYLLKHSFYFNDSIARDHALFSLKQLLNGGIYDQLAGGMSRYSTDSKWLAPHFEKMLYDNALLINVLCDAFQLTGEAFYEDGIHLTLDFILKEMKHPSGGFYAAFDADSEGEEGKFYVWDKQEILEILGQEGELCCKWFGVTESGNWEDKNILHIHSTIEAFAAENGLEISHLQQKIKEWKKALLQVRNKRIHPATDDKLLLGWNALLLTALCKAFAATGLEIYRAEAIELAAFLKEKFTDNKNALFHTYKDGKPAYPAFLDDYSYLIQAYIHMQEITSEQHYLLEARMLTEYVISQFKDGENAAFKFTNKEQTDIVVRKTEIHDGAVPSGNSVMVQNLSHLGIIFNIPEWSDLSREMLFSLKDVIIKHPGSFGVWAGNILKEYKGMKEIVVTGNDIEQIKKEILTLYIPDKIFQSSNLVQDFPLLTGKNFTQNALIHVCKEYACHTPVTSVNEMKNQLI